MIINTLDRHKTWLMQHKAQYLLRSMEWLNYILFLGIVGYTWVKLVMLIRPFHVKTLYANNWSERLKLLLKHNMCLDSAISFQFSQMLILLMVQASTNAANWKRRSKVNSISYWLSLAQLKTNVAFFIALRMHSLSHESLFHCTHRLRRLTAFGFVSLIP